MPHAGWTKRGYHPNFDAAHEVQHVVFRLADSLPPSASAEVKAAAPANRLFAAESVLDAGRGDRLLGDPRAASAVQESLLHFDGARYRLLAWCVMSTHVHVLIDVAEGWPLASIVQGWKSFTAHAINRVLDRRGKVWARDYFDRAMRTEGQTNATVEYIEANPVKAGLCRRSEDWPWSSASRRGEDAGETPADLK